MNVNGQLDLQSLPNEDLLAILSNAFEQNAYTHALTELLTKLCNTVAEQQKEIELLKAQTPVAPVHKSGRKRADFYYQASPLTDDYLIYLIDYNYFTIPELELEVGAKKNQLRNRYNRAKEQRRDKPCR